MGFTVINEGFVCEICGTSVPLARSTCRNHCTQCLASKHVDEKIPGDRASACKGIMYAIRIEGTDPDKLDIVHRCKTCGKEQRNKIAIDDDKEAIVKLIKQTSSPR